MRGFFRPSKQSWHHVVHKYDTLEDVISQEMSKLLSAVGSNGMYRSLALHEVMQSGE